METNNNNLNKKYRFSLLFFSFFQVFPFLSILVYLSSKVLRFLKDGNPYMRNFKEINYDKSFSKLRNMYMY